MQQPDEVVNQPPAMTADQPIPVSLTDLYQIIGEREVLRVMQQRRIVELMTENDALRSRIGNER